MNGFTHQHVYHHHHYASIVRNSTFSHVFHSVHMWYALFNDTNVSQSLQIYYNTQNISYSSISTSITQYHHSWKITFFIVQSCLGCAVLQNYFRHRYSSKIRSTYLIFLSMHSSNGIRSVCVICDGLYHRPLPLNFVKNWKH
jgi:hypothetical protein